MTSERPPGVTMISRPWLWALTLPAGVLWCAAPAQAIELNGLWSSDPALCDKIFIKKGKQVAFSPLSDLYGSGFIIDGNRIRGKIARCTIKSRKQDGDTLLLAATCSTTIAAQDLEFSWKTVDDNPVSRLFRVLAHRKLNSPGRPP